ncbi:hypothetical protein FZEAL_996 [Fusarium zealandicum]|uniref:Myb-like domain-containing protein n=1 Tax=Fusarium zealandicum TaxID=1053134 RepID=A0A8H4UU37_9HYPO|nr:hypothetical protein FZEAL_996 [Fusarium zealandicum]
MARPFFPPKNFHLSMTNAMLDYSPIVPGYAELPARETPQRPVELDGTEISLSSGGNRSSSNVSWSEDESLCNRSCNKQCAKGKCPKNRCVKKGGRGKSVRWSEEYASDNAATTESSGETKSETTQESRKVSFKGKKNKAKGGKSSTEVSSNATTTDNESSAQTDQVSTDADTHAASSSNASTKNDDPAWSMSEDCLLRGMKEGDQGATWADIAAALNKSKNDVKARWNVIKKQAVDTDTDNDTSGAASETQGDDTSLDDGGEEATEKKKVAKGKGKAKAKASKQDVSTSSGEEASEEESSESSAASASSSSQLGYGDPEKRREMRYLQDHIYKELYPAEIHPEPDAYFGKRDCNLLAAIDSKYKRSRWLEMQANFYNVTGRMVPLSVIRDKCERAEEEAAERVASQELSGRLKKVERWISKVSGLELEDPES